ncbi:MAG: hypothetical protein HFG51_15800 [Lachnospiraceae bacterium]|mgnify:CR=1 FL=1|nr:hypothetical protein [Coprobacillus sp.]MCI9595549.1 hypothetical protein [Lachnospiraceae bacterium]
MYGLYAYPGAKGIDSLHYVELMKYKDDSGQPITRFVETCFGAGNVVATASTYPTRITNELNTDIYRLAKMICTKDYQMDVLQQLLCMEITKEQFQKCKDQLGKTTDNEVYYCACVWFVHLFSFNGRGEQWSEASLNKKLLTDSRLNSLDLYKGIEVKNKDMLDLLNEEKKQPELMAKTMYFLDPPYMNNNVKYKENEAAKREFHLELVELLKGIPYVMLCGYDNDVYNKHLCEELGYYKYCMGEKKLSANVVAKNSIRKTNKEYIWTSYPVKGVYLQ